VVAHHTRLHRAILGDHSANNKLGGQVRKEEKSTPIVFWRIYVGGVEVESIGDQHEPEHEQEERQGGRRFVLRCYSVFNTEQCELPPSVTEELALPEERMIDPMEACERGLLECPTSPRSRQDLLFAGDRAHPHATVRIV